MPRWVWRSFQELTPDELYDICALRQTVFVVEQNCAYLDADGRDRRSRHLYTRDASGLLIAYLRLVEPGVKYPEPSLGRVITHPGVRRTGVGRALMAEGLRGAAEYFPGSAIRIGAQLWAEEFYRSLGFERVGEEYIEDDIPHVEMLRP
ncbi:MAG TPA: GNAT family N-acetyltransferase [Gemmatimonadaceae bacterium]|nr:GNAT family N-acetyltransferase [Gemmatimonadaceae bacterium]